MGGAVEIDCFGGGDPLQAGVVHGLGQGFPAAEDAGVVRLVFADCFVIEEEIDDVAGGLGKPSGELDRSVRMVRP